MVRNWKPEQKMKNRKHVSGQIADQFIEAYFPQEKNNEILGYNNQLAGLQTRLDAAQSQAVKWESKWTHIKNTAAKKTLLLGRIKM